MASPLADLILGGVIVPNDAGHEMDQEYEALEATNVIRFADGSARKVTMWDGKIRTQVSGSGRLPSGLSSLNYAGELTMGCIAPRSVWSQTNVLQVPSARRPAPKYEPLGVALLPEFGYVPTDVSMNGDEATLTAVTGATAYIALYWPQLVVLASAPRDRFDRRAATWRWNLEAVEV